MLEEKNEINYVAACSDKMRNASSHQCKEKMSGSEKKVNENAYDISSIKKFLEQQQRNIQNKCAACAKLFFFFFANYTSCRFSTFSGVAFAA